MSRMGSWKRSSARQDGLDGNDAEETPRPLSASLKDNLDTIREVLGGSDDIVIRPIRLSGGVAAAIVFTDGLANEQLVAEFILDRAMTDDTDQETERTGNGTKEIVSELERHILAVGELEFVHVFKSLFHALLSGNTIVLLDGLDHAIAAGTKGWKDRGVTETNTESVIRGPREAFSETLRTNTALIRRRIKSPRLRLETRRIGRETQTDVSIMYMQGIANDKIVEEVRKRLDNIDIDGILESGYIEELIQDETYTPFPTVYNTERPDVIAAELLEGKVAILVDGTPFVLIVPAVFVSFLHAAEDYYHRADISTLIRLLRYVGIFIALYFPSLYVAITTFHQEMLPTQLLISLAAQREGIPFPAFIEAFMMEVAFEILKEAGLRMPRTIGPAVSIVGTLVIGQAAVEAGIVSAAMVIVVSTTAISSFVFPAYSMANAIRMLRFPLMGLAASFGLFGIILGTFAIVLHLTSLRTFGVPYLTPFAPMKLEDQKDAIFRLPHWMMTKRPGLMTGSNGKRQQPAKAAKPKPDK
nr:spore germination protein [Paenibacillus agaridevorans]